MTGSRAGDLGEVGPPGASRLLDDRGPLRKGKFNQESFQPCYCVLLLEGVMAEVTALCCLLDPCAVGMHL